MSEVVNCLGTCPFFGNENPAAWENHEPHIENVGSWNWIWESQQPFVSWELLLANLLETVGNFNRISFS